MGSRPTGNRSARRGWLRGATAALIVGLALGRGGSSPGVAGPRQGEVADLLFPFLTRVDDSPQPLLAQWITPEVMEYILASDRIPPSPSNYLALRFFRRTILIYLRPPDEGEPADWSRLRERVYIVDSLGRRYPPLSPPRRLAPAFRDPPAGGTQALLFPAETPEGEPIAARGILELVVERIGGVPERRFRWQAPIRYPVAAREAIAACRREIAARLRAYRIPPAERLRAAIAWMGDLLRAGDDWLIVAWIPRAWWVAALGATAGVPDEQAARIASECERTTTVALLALEPAAAERVEHWSRRVSLELADGRTLLPAGAPELTTLLRTIVADEPLLGELPIQVIAFPTAPTARGFAGARLRVHCEGSLIPTTLVWRPPIAVPRGLVNWVPDPGIAAARRPLRLTARGGRR